MNKNRLLQSWHIGCTLLAALFMSSCSQDELDGTQGEPLPTGQYPLELTASIGEATATPATRCTVHGEWPSSGTVLIKIASSKDYPNESEINWYNVRTYFYKIDANGRLTFDDPTYDPIYWRSSDEKLYICAYYNLEGGTYFEGQTWDVLSDQSDESNLNNGDYLCAFEDLSFGGDGKLNFRHLTSKITINIKESAYLNAHKDDVSVALVTKENEKWYMEGKFNGSRSGMTLLAEDGLQQAEQIIPYKNPKQTGGIYATYEAVLIPQQITETGKAIQIKVGDATYSYTLECSKNKFSSGEEWTYDITVNAEDVEVNYSFVRDGIGWGNGNSSGGSVEIL